MSFLSNVIRARLQTAAQRMEQNTISILRGKLSSWGLSIPIGCLGPVVFTVSSSEVRTFSDWKREAKGRYATHNVMGGRPVLEFLGTDLQTITFTMRLSVFLGVNPANEAAKLRQLCEDGTSMPLVIGNEPVGENNWIIESIGEETQEWDNNGNILISTLQVTLKEYVGDMIVLGGDYDLAMEGDEES